MKCDGSTLLPPCQELCLRYCEKCALGVCPCTDLPAKSKTKLLNVIVVVVVLWSLFVGHGLCNT